MNIAVISGSRADYGLLEWPLHCLRADPFFAVAEIHTWGHTPASALQAVTDYLAEAKPDCILILGDRFEILAAAMAAHLQRIPIAHIAGGDVTEGSYDDAMRDCISRMAAIHFATSSTAQARLITMGYRNVHMVGSTAIDYIRNAPWKKARPLEAPYTVCSYQAETIDGGNEIHSLIASLPANTFYILPNADRGSHAIRKAIETHISPQWIIEYLPHGEFLNLLAHCEEFVGNSSAILYEAPELGIKTRMIGKRQRGRVLPEGDGRASERIVQALKRGAL